MNFSEGALMLTVPQQVKIFVALQPTDMRRGFPGLSGEVQSTLQEDPLSGHLFLFHNRRRDRIKILFWEGDGYAIYYKQLSLGSFEFPPPQDPNSPVVQIRASELAMLLDGIELKGRKRRPRYERSS
jgi:transposase